MKTTCYCILTHTIPRSLLDSCGKYKRWFQLNHPIHVNCWKNIPAINVRMKWIWKSILPNTQVCMSVVLLRFVWFIEKVNLPTIICDRSVCLRVCGYVHDFYCLNDQAHFAWFTSRGHLGGRSGAAQGQLGGSSGVEADFWWKTTMMEDDFILVSVRTYCTGFELVTCEILYFFPFFQHGQH